MSKVIDWKYAVLEYKGYNGDDLDNLSEFIESYMPDYYGEIIETYGRIHGSPLGIKITKKMVGLSMWQILNWYIHDEYMEQFMSAWNEAEEEE
tara:strand:- start:732 stop:1010 length:279 start_codon:yes stop_codon:yes gene_type:complete